QAALLLRAAFPLTDTSQSGAGRPSDTWPCSGFSLNTNPHSAWAIEDSEQLHHDGRVRPAHRGRGATMSDAGTVAQPAEADARTSSRVGGVLAPAGSSWALFEFARNPYFMLIVTYVFPPYFAQFVIGDPVEGQAAVAEATKWAGIIGALTAPLLGVMMDRGGARKPLMAVFLAMVMVSGVSLWWAMPGAVDSQGVFQDPVVGLGVVGTMSFLVLGYVGYTYSEMMHNAMLRTSGRPESLSQISGAGIGLGQ